jgi:hypothetical protein
MEVRVTGRPRASAWALMALATPLAFPVWEP